MQRILIGTDGSEGAQRALRTAAQLSKATAAELLIVTVSQPRLSGSQISEAEDRGFAPGNLLELTTRRIAQDARELAINLGAAQTRIIDAAGDAAIVLIDIAVSEGVDMIVVGRRGRGRLAGLLLGSVSQKLASLAPCSVLIVP